MHVRPLAAENDCKVLVEVEGQEIIVVQISTEQYSVIPCRTVQCGTVRYSAVRYSEARYSAGQCSTVWAVQ